MWQKFPKLLRFVALFPSQSILVKLIPHTDAHPDVHLDVRFIMAIVHGLSLRPGGPKSGSSPRGFCRKVSRSDSLSTTVLCTKELMTFYDAL